MPNALEDHLPAFLTETILHFYMSPANKIQPKGQSFYYIQGISNKFINEFHQTKGPGTISLVKSQVFVLKKTTKSLLKCG